jgi:hypothetical protein
MSNIAALQILLVPTRRTYVLSISKKILKRLSSPGSGVILRVSIMVEWCESFTTTLLAVSSGLLLIYWFRYTCLLILAARTVRDYGVEVASANCLCFPEVQWKLQQPNRSVRNLDRLHRCLNRDYLIVTRLSGYTAGFDGDERLERFLLVLDFQAMSAWYRVSRRFSTGEASRALEEMALVVAHFADSIGERVSLKLIDAGGF